MAANLPVSPITGTHNVSVFDTINVRDIVRIYQEQEQIDVGRFFVGIDKVTILECGDTGYRFYYPFTVVGDEKFYQELAGVRSEVGVEYDRDWSEDHEFAYALVEQNEKVLEIGCNTGKFLSRVTTKTQRLTGLEFNAEAAAAARSRGLDVRNLDIADLAESEPESFDVVCAFQVLEHVSQAGDFLRSCLKALKPGGKLIFSVPNNEPYFQRFSKYEVLNLPPHHMGLWNHDSFRRAASFFDLHLEKSLLMGTGSVKGEVYLRSKYLARVCSPANRESAMEKVKMISVLPFAMIMSGVDRALGRKGHGQIAVALRRR